MTKRDIDKLRTKVWYEAIRLISGLKSAAQIELALSGKDRFERIDGSVIRPRQFDRYRDGRMVPNRQTRNYVEAHFPGTMAWFDHAFWLLGMVDNTSNLERVIRQLEPEVQKEMFHRSQIGGLERLPVSSAKLRRRLPAIVRAGGMGGVTALCILMFELHASFNPSKKVHSWILFENIYQGLRNVFFRLATLTPLKVAAPEIAYYIDSVCLENGGRAPIGLTEGAISNVLHEHSELLRRGKSLNLIGDDYRSKDAFLLFFNFPHEWDRISRLNSAYKRQDLTADIIMEAQIFIRRGGIT